MPTNFFDYDSGRFGHPISDNMAIDTNGDLLLRISENTALDTATGEVHTVSCWEND